MSANDAFLGFSRYVLGLSQTRKTARVLRIGVGITATESDSNETPEELSLSVGTRIEDGVTFRLYLQNPPSFNEIVGGVTGISMATMLSLGISLTRTGAGVYLLAGLPTVTLDGGTYEPRTPSIIAEFAPVLLAARYVYPNQIEMRTHNTSGVAADISGLGVLLRVPYRRIS